MTRRSPSSTLFPYTTLFRSARGAGRPAGTAARASCGRTRARTRPARRRGSSDRKSTRSELQSPMYLVCRLLLEKKKKDEQIHKLGRANATQHLVIGIKRGTD